MNYVLIDDINIIQSATGFAEIFQLYTTIYTWAVTVKRNFFASLDSTEGERLERRSQH